MSKRVILGAKPTPKPQPSADAWVETRGQDVKEPMKRLTIDVPASLHSAIKMACASRGAKIADEVRELLLDKYTSP